MRLRRSAPRSASRDRYSVADRPGDLFCFGLARNLGSPATVPATSLTLPLNALVVHSRLLLVVWSGIDKDELCDARIRPLTKITDATSKKPLRHGTCSVDQLSRPQL
jgi:hypothetical protein